MDSKKRFLIEDGDLLFPQCNNCKHRIVSEHRKCLAFPDRVPDDVYYNKHDHTKPYPNDNGILFESLTLDK